MKVYVDKNELYPCYYLTIDESEPSIEITGEQFEFIMNTMKNFREAQEILSRAYKN
jgi:hypothetical protein